MVALEELVDPDEAALVRALVERHAALTGSALAGRLLADWSTTLERFVRVVPHDYQRVLEAQAQMRSLGMSEAEAEMAAFEANARDLARAGGT